MNFRWYEGDMSPQLLDKWDTISIIPTILVINTNFMVTLLSGNKHEKWTLYHVVTYRHSVQIYHVNQFSSTFLSSTNL